jgi:hypothetical protein
MVGSKSAAAWNLAGRQHGLVTRRNLLDLGFGPRSIEHRIKSGRLHGVTRGVYAVGWPGLTPKRRWMAAVLACGEGAALSHRSAACLWGIGSEHDALVDVSVRHRTRRRRPEILIHNRPSLPLRDITTVDGIPLTTPARTLVDLATQSPPVALERAVNEADKRDLIDPEALRAALVHFAGEPGVRALRTLLDRHTFQLSDSDLEVFFRPIAAAAGLPPPLGKQWVNGFEVDFHWPDLDLVVETDGLRYHRTPAAQARDRLRDQAHVAAGSTVLRFTHHQVRFDPAHVRKVLTKTVVAIGRCAY